MNDDVRKKDRSSDRISENVDHAPHHGNLNINVKNKIGRPRSKFSLLSQSMKSGGGTPYFSVFNRPLKLTEILSDNKKCQNLETNVRVDTVTDFTVFDFSNTDLTCAIGNIFNKNCCHSFCKNYSEDNNSINNEYANDHENENENEVENEKENEKDNEKQKENRNEEENENEEEKENRNDETINDRADIIVLSTHSSYSESSLECAKQIGRAHV